MKVSPVDFPTIACWAWVRRIVSQILRWVVDPMVLVSVAILLAFCLAVVLIQKHGKSKGLLAMRREFYRYRRDMQSKVDAGGTPLRSLLNGEKNEQVIILPVALATQRTGHLLMLVIC